MLKAIKELEAKETIVDKSKKNIKRLDTSIDVAHDSSTFYSSNPFSALDTTSKHAATANAQAYIS